MVVFSEADDTIVEGLGPPPDEITAWDLAPMPGVKIEEIVKEFEYIQRLDLKPPAASATPSEQLKYEILAARRLRLVRIILADYYERYPETALKEAEEIMRASSSGRGEELPQPAAVIETPRTRRDHPEEEEPISPPKYKIIYTKDETPLRVAFHPSALANFDILFQVPSIRGALAWNRFSGWGDAHSWKVVNELTNRGIITSYNVGGKNGYEVILRVDTFTLRPGQDLLRDILNAVKPEGDYPDTLLMVDVPGMDLSRIKWQRKTQQGPILGLENPPKI